MATNKLFPTDKNELISHLEEVLKSIPLKNEGMRQECKQLIKQLKTNAPNFPTDKQVAAAQTKEFLTGSDHTIGVHERFDVSPAKTAKKRPHKGG